MNEPNQHFQQARLAMRQRNHEAARQYAEAALQMEPQRVEILNLLATIAFATKDYAAAIERFQQVAAADPKDGMCLVNQGAVYNRMGQHQDAIKVLQKAVRKAPREATAYYNLALAHRGLGQPSMAITAYRESLRLDPTMADAHLNLANLFVEMGNHQQGIIHYRKALELKPDFERARKGLTHAMGLASDSRAAESPFGRLVNPDEYTQSGTEQKAQTMSDDDRFADRKEVKMLVTSIRNRTDEFLKHVKNDLTPSLLKLNRSLAQISEKSLNVEDKFETFRESVAKANELRRMMKRKLLELRAHEEMKNVPDLPDDAFQ